jgi:hypothetical protein
MNKSNERRDLSIIPVVKAHLKSLASLSMFNSDEPTLKVASSSLRALLVENMLLRVWKVSCIGGPLIVKAWCIVSAQQNAAAFCGGGDILPGIPMSICFNAELAEYSLDLTSFCKKTRIQVGQEKASTIDIVKYAANTLGGVHFDPDGRNLDSRKPVFDFLRRIDRGNINLNGLSFNLNDRNLLHHEILSISQSIVSSNSVENLLNLRLT